MSTSTLLRARYASAVVRLAAGPTQRVRPFSSSAVRLAALPSRDWGARKPASGGDESSSSKPGWPRNGNANQDRAPRNGSRASKPWADRGERGEVGESKFKKRDAAPHFGMKSGGNQSAAKGTRAPARKSSPASVVDTSVAPEGFLADVGIEEDELRQKPRQAKWKERESRSLLHSRDGDFLPSTHHHSEKGRKGRGEKGMKGDRRGKGDKADKAGRDRNSRQWVDDAEAEQAAKAEYERQEAEKRLKEAEKLRKAKAAKAAARASTEKDVFIPETISVAQLAVKFGVKAIKVMSKMVSLGMKKEQCTPYYLLNSDDASNIALEFNLNPIIDMEKGFDIYPEPEDGISQHPLRPPVVTIMGHVDHGKTTLLDSLRKTSVAAGEAGGITQHIAAFSLPLSSIMPEGSAPTDAAITFLDTPGHAAFTGMRARGASVTDLVVLVVAADDGVMPQTKEVIELVKRAGDSVGLVVAINKCDKPSIDVDRVKAGLGSEGIILEEDGGEVPSVRVSGLTKMGLDDLVETLSTLAEIRDLRARTTGKAEGFVLESHVNKGLGTVSTVLISRGQLHIGDAIVAGNSWANVRTMVDSNGREVQSAGPGTPVTITGWRDVPIAGDMMLQAVNGEEEAKKCIANRLRDAERKAMMADVEVINARRQEDRARHAADMETIQAAKAAGKNITHLIHAQRRAADASRESDKKELRLVIKGDVTGTVEAVVGSLAPIGNAEVGVKIVHTGVGEVNESDIMLAESCDGTVIGFNVDCPRSIQTLANMSEVPTIVDSVIYRLIDNVRARVSELLPPKIEYRITGESVVQQIFEIKVGRKVNAIAGCKVNNGTILKNEGVRVLRGKDREVVYEGTMETLKHLKKDVSEIRKGMECGIGLKDFSEFKEGDEIVTFNRVEVPRSL